MITSSHALLLWLINGPLHKAKLFSSEKNGNALGRKVPENMSFYNDTSFTVQGYLNNMTCRLVRSEQY